MLIVITVSILNLNGIILCLLNIIIEIDWIVIGEKITKALCKVEVIKNIYMFKSTNLTYNNNKKKNHG
jgi:hypothetical protein